MILPPPGPAFTWTRTPAGYALVCRPLGRVARHLFTTRAWLLGSAEGENTETAWRDVADAIETPPDQLLRVHQVHGADIVVHRAAQPSASGAPADIIATDDASTALAIQTADCVPLLIADLRTGAVAAAHAGWRGTALGVAGAAVKTLVHEFGSRPSDLIAAVGPSIGPCCYQVGTDVRDRFAWEGFTDEELSCWFTAQADRLVLDLWIATRDQLAAAGLPRDQIFVSEMCTASHRDAFCSYRRDGVRAGRMAAAIRKLELRSENCEGQF